MARARRRKTPQKRLNGKQETATPSIQTVDTVPTTRVGSAQLEQDDAINRYATWLPPTAIVSDGAYGLGLFPGDPISKDELLDWYAPHVEAWSQYALPLTTLWFWCSEIGWPTVHPLLEEHGWQYESFNVWNKGIGHVAGNVNGKTIRRFPVVTEACVLYTRKVQLPTIDGQNLSLKEWLRFEWQRAGIPLTKANEACGVVDAATRKYLTQCHLWYFPPPDKMAQLVDYANKYGKPTDRLYFSINGKNPATAEEWGRMRSKWNHAHAITNVWTEAQVRGEKRIKVKGNHLHANQKPLRLIEQIITASSDPNDVIWEPFGGLCPTAVVSLRTGRCCYSAEIDSDFYKAAKSRLEEEYSNKQLCLFPESISVSDF